MLRLPAGSWFCCLTVCAACSFATAAEVSPVVIDSSGKLQYLPLESGDKVMDFSQAGYGGGGVALPVVPTSVTVSPSADRNDAPVIQKAIDAVESRSASGLFRGAVQLAPGDYYCNVPLLIRASGVVLRGSGQGEHGSAIHLIGPPHKAIEVGDGRELDFPTSGVAITDSHVPSGATRFSVSDGSRFHSGDPVAVVRTVTPHWVEFMGMDALERNGKHETWVKGRIGACRTVVNVEGNVLTLDVPLSDDIDRAQMGTDAFVAFFKPERSPSNVGIESLAIVASVQHAAITDRVYSGIRIRRATDAWIRDVSIFETIGTIDLTSGAQRVSVENVHIEHTTATIGAAKPADFSVDGSQILIDRCTDKGDELFYIATGAAVVGPNVILNCTFEGGGWIQPHQRWATGLLVDSCSVPGGGIDFMNRGQMGSGHGWTIGWAVAWNCTAKEFVIQRPPGSMNWGVGCTGKLTGMAMPFGKAPILASGIWVSQNEPVDPSSLYLAQLRERLGPSAVKAIDY